MNRAISILVHGSAKSGKSTLAATAPAPRLLLDCEASTRFLNINPVRWDPNTEAPPVYDGSWDTCVVTVRQYDDVIKAYQWLQSGKHPFKSTIVDSISELQQKLIEKVSNRMQMQTQDWGEVLRNFMGTMRDFRDLTEHKTKPQTAVVLVAMSVPGNESNGGKQRPFAQGQSRIMLPYLFDILGAMHVDTWIDDSGVPQEMYRLLIGPNRVYETGERVGGRLSGYLDNPTIPEILDKIFGPEETEAATAVEA